MVKKWFKPRGKPVVLVDEKEINNIIIKHIEVNEKLNKKKKGDK